MSRGARLKRNQEFKNPHEIPIKHYFDIAAGIRGSDKGHAAATEYYNKIMPMLERESGTAQVASEGLKIAEETRVQMANLLGCEPRNIFFGNSAMRTLLPIFLSLGKMEKYTLIADDIEFMALKGLVNADLKALATVTTRQNFGGNPENKLLRSFDDFALLPEFRKQFGLTFQTGIEFMESMMPEGTYIKKVITKNSGIPYVKLIPLMREVDSDELHLIYRSITDRYGMWYMRSYLSKLEKTIRDELRYMYISDASHSVGIDRIKAPGFGDIVVMNSSKALGAEPTIGICYVSDRMLNLIEKVLSETSWPRIAFQFSLETRLGVKNVGDIENCLCWISLPELFSLHEVTRSLDMKKRTLHFDRLNAYITAAFTLFAKTSKEISIINRKPDYAISNMFSFSFFNSENYLPQLFMFFVKKLSPFVLNHEKFYDHIISPEERFEDGITEVKESRKEAIRFRISWSHEHTLEDARSLCKKIANALDEVFFDESNGCSKILERFDHIFFASSMNEAMDTISSETQKDVLLAIGNHHEDESVCKTALMKIKPGLDRRDHLMLDSKRRKRSGL